MNGDRLPARGPGLLFRVVSAGPVGPMQGAEGAEGAGAAGLPQAFRNAADGWRGHVYGMK